LIRFQLIAALQLAVHPRTHFCREKTPDFEKNKFSIYVAWVQHITKTVDFFGWILRYIGRTSIVSERGCVFGQKNRTPVSGAK
jgi:hypothetical protein